MGNDSVYLTTQGCGTRIRIGFNTKFCLSFLFSFFTFYTAHVFEAKYIL